MLNWTVLNRTDYLHKNGFGINNLQKLICHKTQQTKPNQTKPRTMIKTQKEETDSPMLG